MIHKRLSIAVLAVVAAVAPTLTASVASADETTAAQPRVELVLDVSGSMRAKDIDGRSRISVAQNAFNEVVDALPDTTRLGIRVLGATYPGDNKKIACRDTQQIVPVGQVDRAQAKDAIATLRPTGYTPIGLALREAARDLGDEGNVRRIVLITDGEDTCAPPDPCEVARELAARGTHLVVDTLGLAPDEKVRRQLVCIANATGGTYTAAQSSRTLTNRMKQLVDRAADTPVATPATVTGTSACDSAPVLSPGLYTDRENFSEHRWYRVSVPPGRELRAAVSIALDRPLTRDYGVLVRAVTLDGRELVRGADAGSDRIDVLSTGLRWSAVDDADDDDDGEDGDDEDSDGQDGSLSSTIAAGDDAPTVVCLVISNSFAPNGASATDAPGMPLELSIDVVRASPAPDAPGLGRGWLLLFVLGLAGLVTGLLAGWLTRWWVAKWR